MEMEFHPSPPSSNSPNTSAREFPIVIKTVFACLCSKRDRLKKESSQQSLAYISLLRDSREQSNATNWTNRRLIESGLHPIEKSLRVTIGSRTIDRNVSILGVVDQRHPRACTPLEREKGVRAGPKKGKIRVSVCKEICCSWFDFLQGWATITRVVVRRSEITMSEFDRFEQSLEENFRTERKLEVDFSMRGLAFACFHAYFSTNKTRIRTSMHFQRILRFVNVI